MAEARSVLLIERRDESNFTTWRQSCVCDESNLIAWRLSCVCVLRVVIYYKPFFAVMHMSLLTGFTKLLPSLHLSGKLCWSRCPLTWPSAKWQLMASYPWRKCVPLFLHLNCFVFDGFLRKFVVADPIVGLALDVADREFYARFASIIFSGCSVRTSWLTATSRGRRSTLLRLTPDRCFL